MIIVVSSILTDFVPSVPITQDILLISIFGGLINGTAISLALIGGSSTGGTDFIAVYFAEKKNKDVWNYILMGNGVVLVMAGILFGWDKALYSIIFQFTSTQTIHLLYQAYNKVTLFIVTDNPKAVYEAIYQVTNHSATEFTATGMYSNEGRKMIYSVVSSTEAKVLIRKVMNADPHAFVNVVKTDILMGRFIRKRIIKEMPDRCKDMITKILNSPVGQMISTWRMSEEGLRLGNQILQEKDNLGEAIVRAVKCVEDDPAYVSVGYGGLPNREGQVELDAAYMDGDTLGTGAVISVKNLKNPIEAAYRLSKKNRSCILAGDGAMKYASYEGLAYQNMLTESSRKRYEEELKVSKTRRDKSL